LIPLLSACLLLIVWTTPGWAQGPRPGRQKRAPPTAQASRAGPTTQTSALRLSLAYNKDVGFAPGGADALAIGPDHLTAADGQVAALYDVVRRQVLVVTPSGVRARFGVSPADALLIPEPGRVAVLDAGSGRIRVSAEDGSPQGDLRLPTQLRTGERLSLEGTALIATSVSGERREVAQLVGGRLKPPSRQRNLSPPVELKAQGQSLRIGSETETVPDAVRVAGRLLGGRPPWIEVQIVRRAGPGISVERRARRGRHTIPLPSGARSYTPTGDVAVAPNGQLVYLEPQADAVHVVWQAKR